MVDGIFYLHETSPHRFAGWVFLQMFKTKITKHQKKKTGKFGSIKGSK
jgi:hypothetical protein